MTEREKLSKLTAAVKKALPDIFWYKIPDTRIGHKKPFDVFAMCDGDTFAFEFKAPKGVLAEHQKEALLTAASNGCCACVVTFLDNPKMLHFDTSLLKSVTTKQSIFLCKLQLLYSTKKRAR